MTSSNHDVYRALWGPSEVFVTGSLRQWSPPAATDMLTLPILLTCGRSDEVTPALINDAASMLPDATRQVFEHSAHMAHLEETGEFVAAVSHFLDT